METFTAWNVSKGAMKENGPMVLEPGLGVGIQVAQGRAKRIYFPVPWGPHFEQENTANGGLWKERDQQLI